MNVVRGTITNLTDPTSSTPLRIFTSDGRANEVISGRFFQHYGFMSKPPVGTDHITLQYGDNQVSVAESSGIAAGKTLNSGDVLIFTDPNGNGNKTSSILMTAPSSAGDLSILIQSNGLIYIQNDKAYISIGSEGQIEISNTAGGTITIDKDSGQINMNNGNLTVDK